MDLPVHFVACALLAALLWPWFHAQALLVFATGFLIDADHLLWYFFAHGMLNPKKIYHEAKYGTETGKLDIFHTIEFFLAALIFSWLFLRQFFLPLALGLVSHQLLDLAYFVWFAKSRAVRRYPSAIEWLLAGRGTRGKE